MCLVLIALEAHPEYPLIVAANRDEFYDRPTSPAGFWPEHPSLLAGRDLKAGGTWLGIDREARFAAVTNYRQGQRERPAARSRGRLVSDFLSTDIGAFDHLRQAQRNAGLYSGFNLIAGDGGGVFYYSNHDGPIRRLEPGLYGLSNHLLDTPWPKVRSAKTALGALLHQGVSDPTGALFALLSNRQRPPDDQLPSTGVGPQWEQLLSSAFIASDQYGTRSSTVILVSHAGRVVFVERGFGPGGSTGAVTGFEFQRGADTGPGGRAGRSCSPETDKPTTN